MNQHPPLAAYAITLVLLSAACSKSNNTSHSAAKTASSAPSDVPAKSVASTTTPSVVHDPANPPIDCPLRKAGIDQHGLKPFEDVQTYIAFLEREDRNVWQKPDELIRALRLTDNEVVADIGAGSGYFTFRFASVLPRGKVFAVDIEPEMVRHIHHKAMTQGIKNVEAIVATDSDPKVRPETTLVFVCDVLHHVHDRPAWLKTLSNQVRHDTRLVIVEFKEGDLPQGPPSTMKIPKDQIQSLVRSAGFESTGEIPNLLPYQVILQFKKAT